MTKDEDNKQNWLNNEVKTLIQLKDAMQLEAMKNSKRQGM